MTDKYYKLCHNCPFGTMDLDSLQRKLDKRESRLAELEEEDKLHNIVYQRECDRVKELEAVIERLAESTRFAHSAGKCEFTERLIYARNALKSE